MKHSQSTRSNDDDRFDQEVKDELKQAQKQPSARLWNAFLTIATFFLLVQSVRILINKGIPLGLGALATMSVFMFFFTWDTRKELLLDAKLKVKIRNRLGQRAQSNADDPLHDQAQIFKTSRNAVTKRLDKQFGVGGWSLIVLSVLVVSILFLKSGWMVAGPVGMVFFILLRIKGKLLVERTLATDADEIIENAINVTLGHSVSNTTSSKNYSAKTIKDNSVPDATIRNESSINKSTTHMDDDSTNVSDAKEGVDKTLKHSHSRSRTSNATQDVQFDLNEASYQDLLSLPGIGAVEGKRIIKYRSENRRFTSIDEAVIFLDLKPYHAKQWEKRVFISPAGESASPHQPTEELSSTMGGRTID